MLTYPDQSTLLFTNAVICDSIHLRDTVTFAAVYLPVTKAAVACLAQHPLNAYSFYHRLVSSIIKLPSLCNYATIHRLSGSRHQQIRFMLCIHAGPRLSEADGGSRHRRDNGSQRKAGRRSMSLADNNETEVRVTRCHMSLFDHPLFYAPIWIRSCVMNTMKLYARC